MAAGLVDREVVSGKLDERSSRGCCRFQRAKQAMLFFRGACGEIERSHVAGAAAIAELESPQFVDFNAVAVFVLQVAEESSRCWVEGINTGIAFAKVAN